MKFFIMSDIHGKLDILKKNLEVIDFYNSDNNKLILLGDYFNRLVNVDYSVVSFIMDLKKNFGDRVITLMGNHELYYLEDVENGKFFDVDYNVVDFIKNLPYYFETDNQIFVHAGIDEDAGDYWKDLSSNDFFCNKYPHTVGKFSKDIISGHIGSGEIARFHGDDLFLDGDIFFDGDSHYYIDGTVEVSNIIPILVYDTLENSYSKIIDGNISYIDNFFENRDY